MTYESTTGQPSTAQTARDEAGSVAHGAAEAGKGLAQEGKEQVKQVAGEAGRQARDLLGAAQGELSQQASTQQHRLAGGLRAFGDELSAMADGAEAPGLASDVARQLARRTSAAAGWLEDREPGTLLTEVAEYARRNPGTFLALAAGAGVLAGRLTRGLKDATDGTPGQGTGAHRAPGAPSTVAPLGSTTTAAWPPVGVEPGAGYEHSVGGGTPVTHTPASTPFGSSPDVGGTALGDPVAGVELTGEPGLEPRREEGWR